MQVSEELSKKVLSSENENTLAIKNLLIAAVSNYNKERIAQILREHEIAHTGSMPELLQQLQVAVFRDHISLNFLKDKVLNWE